MMILDKYLVVIGVICMGTLGKAQTPTGFINNGGNLVIASKTYLRVAGDVVNKNKGKIVNNGKILLGGNYVHTTQATYQDVSGSGIEFVGTAEQTLKLEESTPIVIANLKVQNSQGLVLGGHVSVKESITLSPKNKLKLGNFNVLLAENTQVNELGMTNYFVTNGTGSLQQVMGRTNKFFPVGNSSYNPMQLINTDVTDTFAVRVLDEAPLHQATQIAAKEHAVKRVWELSRQKQGFPLIALELYWATSEELPKFDRTKSVLQFWGTLGSPFPYVDPAKMRNGLWMTSNDLVQLIGKVNQFWIEEPTDIKFPPLPPLSATPNPADTYVNVSNPKENVSKPYTVTSLGGLVVKTGTITDTNQQINVDDLPAGHYFMNVGTSRTRFVKL